LAGNEASAGTAGLITAIGSAGLGAKVALVERHLMGGDCLNYGCVPSNALIRASYHLCSMLRSGLSQRGTSDCVSRPS
jgi:pyruvate/2-oxoglutarate dehydrogenase complex dihydrolipoamide dehydrogenase (E3) component